MYKSPRSSKSKNLSMTDSLKAFADEDNIINATSSFLKNGLGIELWDRGKNEPDKDYFQNRIKIIPQYLQNVLKKIETIIPTEYISKKILKPKKNDESPKERYEFLKLFVCEAKENLTRDDISKLTVAFNRQNSTNKRNCENCPVIVVIRDHEYIHISTCPRSYKEANADKDIVGDNAVFFYKISYEKPGKGHLQLLENMKKEIKGCDTFETLFHKILNSLSINIVSNNFFDEYKSIYEDIILYATGKKMVKDRNNKNRLKEKKVAPSCDAIMKEFASFDDPEKAVRDYVKMLMGRLVFIQFLQKKGWMGVPGGDDKWERGDPNFLQNLFENSDDKDHFVSKVLIPLFQDLNESRKNDRVRFIDKDIKVPYLNGGLFDSDEFLGIRFTLPQEKMKKMLEFFSSYNFTIDESSKDSVDVGVDPEMLSRIFESLLEDNREKGAFYTPKEVVEYMCREALTTYLQNGTDDDAKKELYKDFVKEHNIDTLSTDDIEYLVKRLRKVKICDPAIGSGAFPMGMLKELYECRKAIEQHQSSWSASDIKKDIIQNSIYGVDIEKGAVNIARLRFWLSMIIDEPTPHALPNMDFKIMQGNSLLEQYKGVDLSNLELKVEKPKGKGKKKKNDDSQQELSFDAGSSLKNIQSSIKVYYTTTDHKKKITLRNHINEEIKNYILHMKEFSPKIEKELSVLDIPNDQFFLWHIYFKEVFDQGGFDIVIGNPPYIELQDLGEINKVYKKCGFETYNSSGDIYCLFTEHGFNILKSGGILCYIMMNKWMKANYGKQLRTFILKHKIHSIIDYGDIQIFKNATTYPCIILLGNSVPNKKFGATLLKSDDLSALSELSDEFCVDDFDDNSWVLSSRQGQLLHRKIKSEFDKIEVFIKDEPKRGILSGLSKAFLISEDIRNQLIAEDSSANEVIIPCFAGKDIKPYEIPLCARYLILFKKGITYELMGRNDASEDEAWEFVKARYPSVCNWLAPFKEQAKRRDDKGYYWWELRACAYYDLFEQPKIMYQAIQVKPNFVFDSKGQLCNNSMWFLPTANKALLGLLNSKIGWWLISCYCTQVQNGYQLIWEYFKKIPIALKDEDEIIVYNVDQILNAKAQDNKNADVSVYLNEIDCRLYEIYGLTNGEVKIIDPQAQTFGADFEPYQRKPEFKMVSDEYIDNVYDQLVDRFNKMCDNIRSRELIPTKEYDLLKSGKPDKEELEDAFIKWNCSILTAYRGKKQEINERRNGELKTKMYENGLIFRSVDGFYIEYGDDGNETRNLVNELSFFITNTNEYGEHLNDDIQRRRFFHTIYRLAEHYEQDSFLFTFSGQNRVAFLIATNCYGHDDFRNDIKFAGPLYKDVEDLSAWTGCANGKIAFTLKGVIKRWIPQTKVYIGEGDIFDTSDADYDPNNIIVIHDNRNNDFSKLCNEKCAELGDKLCVEVFEKERPSSDEIYSKIQSALNATPKKSKTIGFHCSVSVENSYTKGAQIAYDAVLKWAANSNKKLEQIVIVDIFGDYYNL